ncbi:hypothetical protein PRIPAC_77973, partial [Pristionchus pacificus]|uniref:Uncharacterized protein n=1 Tax=Pristionchus pacificus TaxID=54126 RepID=A0A2A6BYE8_PRIPA
NRTTAGTAQKCLFSETVGSGALKGAENDGHIDFSSRTFVGFRRRRDDANFQFYAKDSESDCKRDCTCLQALIYPESLPIVFSTIESPRYHSFREWTLLSCASPVQICPILRRTASYFPMPWTHLRVRAYLGNAP